MFGKAFRLPFTLLGIPLLLDISFLLILPLLAWMIARNIGQTIQMLDLDIDAARLSQGAMPLLIGLVAALGLFVSVVLHELGHAITARGYGVRTKSITLWFLGGVAQLEEMPRHRGAEAVIAIAGPIVSFALGALCWAAYHYAAPREGDALRFVLYYLFYVNWFVAIFNLVPALPLDGGRILRSLLALRMPHLRATQLSARISKTLAVLMGIFGLLGGGWMLILVAVFVYMAVTAETQNSLIIELLEGIGVRDLMTRDVVSVSPETPVSELMSKMLREKHLGFPVVDASGRLLGMISLRDLQGADPATPVSQLMQAHAPATTISEDASALEAFQLMGRNNFGRLIVTNGTPTMSGIITKTDLMRAIQVRMAGMGLIGREPPPQDVQLAGQETG